MQIGHPVQQCSSLFFRLLWSRGMRCTDSTCLLWHCKYLVFLFINMHLNMWFPVAVGFFSLEHIWQRVWKNCDCFYEKKHWITVVQSALHWQNRLCIYIKMSEGNREKKNSRIFQRTIGRGNSDGGEVGNTGLYWGEQEGKEGLAEEQRLFPLFFLKTLKNTRELTVSTEGEAGKGCLEAN